MTELRRCGVLGMPVVHSLSPTLHRAAYDALGLRSRWSYDAHEVEESGLAGWLAGLGPEWRGLSLTMPLKHVALGLCTRVSTQARQVDAVNTVLRGHGGDLSGDNTDVPGFVAAWREAGIDHIDRAVVIGAGATARSAVAALAQLGTSSLTVLVRDAGRAGPVEALARSLGMEVAVRRLEERPPSVALAVSTVPVGAHAAPRFEELAAALASSSRGVCDVVYSPRATPLVAAARRSGTLCVEGFDLLLHQAALQVELMTQAGPAPLEQMRTAGLAELARREREG